MTNPVNQNKKQMVDVATNQGPAMTTFSTNRSLATSPAAIFDAISNPARLAAWWGPAGFTNQFDVFEFRPGGKWVFTMIGPDGTAYPNESVFKHIEPNQQVIIQHVCQPHFELAITLTPTQGGTLLRWDQTFTDAAVAQAVEHIAVPANEQNLDRLSAELGLASSSK